MNKYRYLDFSYLNYSKRGTIRTDDWTVMSMLYSRDLPWYKQFRLNAFMASILLSIVFVNIGMFSVYKILLAIPLAYLIWMHIYAVRIHYQLNQLSFTLEFESSRITRGEIAKLNVRFENDTPWPMINLVYGVNFNGNSHESDCGSIGKIAAGKKATSVIDLECEKGAGHYKVDQFWVSLSDGLGLWPQKLSCEVPEANMEVVSPVEDLVKLEDSGQLIHVEGLQESSKVGYSASFYGIREWRHGDSIRYIDWKRSEKYQKLIVKEFDAPVMTEASIIFDSLGKGHSRFQEISTEQALLDTFSALFHSLKNVNAPIRLFTQDKIYDETITRDQAFYSLVKPKLTFHGSESVILNLAKYLPYIPPYGTLYFLSTSACLGQLEKVLPELIYLKERGQMIKMVLIDSHFYASSLRKSVKVVETLEDSLDHFISTMIQLDKTSQKGNLLKHIADNMIAIKPGQDLKRAYESV